MAKRRFQCMLSEGALAELERRAGARDKRQAYLEGLLTGKRGSEGERRVVGEADELVVQSPAVVVDDDSEPDSESAGRVRTERKAARRERKSELQAVVAAALPERVPAVPVPREYAKPCRIHSPKWCAEDCKYRES